MYGLQLARPYHHFVSAKTFNFDLTVICEQLSSRTWALHTPVMNWFASSIPLGNNYY